MDNLVYDLDYGAPSSLDQSTALYMQAGEEMQRVTKAVEAFCE